MTLDGGEFLVANDQVPASTLSVGGAGTGMLTIGNGSEVAVGAALGKPSNNSTTVYPNTGVFRSEPRPAATGRSASAATARCWCTATPRSAARTAR